MAASKLDLLCITTVFLLVTVYTTESLEPSPGRGENSRILNAFDNLKISQRDAQQLTDSWSRILSRRNVRSVVDEFAGNIQSRYGQIFYSDIFDVALNLFLAINEERYRKLETKLQEAGNDIEDIVNLVNNELGSVILVIRNDTLTVSASSLAGIFQKFALDLIRKEFRDNFFLQLALTQLVQEEVAKSTPKLQTVFDSYSLGLKQLRRMLAATSVTRTKRSVNIIDLLIQAVRSQLQTILYPIKTNVDTALDTVSEFVLGLYVSSASSNTVLNVVYNFTNTIVLRAAEVVITFQENVNVFFNNIMYGNGSVTVSESSARRRREARFSDKDDARFGFDEYGNGLDLRKSRTIDVLGTVSSWFSSLTLGLNTAIKQVVVSMFSSTYTAIGQLVTYPLRYILQRIINFIFPCGTNCYIIT